MAAAQLSDRRFEKEGIAVLPVGSKNNLDRPFAIFSSLNIPTYVIWDCDLGEGRKDGKGKIKASNIYLQRLLGVSEPHEDYPDLCTATCACFSDKIETLLDKEIGGEILNLILEEKVSIYGLGGQKEALKNPEVLSEVLADASKKGVRSATLDEIVDRIFDLTDLGAGPIVQQAA